MTIPSDNGPAADQMDEAAVRRVASLARLELSDERVRALAGELSATVGYIQRLRELDLRDVEPMTHPLEMRSRLDADEPGPTLPAAALMKIAPATMPPYVKVPKVLGEGSA